MRSIFFLETHVYNYEMYLRSGRERKDRLIFVFMPKRSLHMYVRTHARSVVVSVRKAR